MNLSTLRRSLTLIYMLGVLSLGASTSYADVPPYQAGAISGHDYRDVSTLNHFTRLVYKNRWKDIRAADVLEQFTAFKGSAASPAMRDTWRDVLLSDFGGLVIQDDQQQALIMAERIRLLNKLGFFDEAVRLYRMAAEIKPVPENVLRQGIDALALSGSADGACLEVMMASRYIFGDDWDQDSALCAAYFGDTKEASALFSKAAPTGGKNFEPVYRMLLDRQDKTIKVAIPPLWRTLLLAKGADVASDAVKDADGMSLAALATSRHVPLDTRLNAALRAADQGTIGFDRLRILYETKYPDEKNGEAFTAAALSGQGLTQPQYYTAARFTFAGKERATIVKNAFKDIKPVTNIQSQVYGWIVDKLTLQVKSLGWFAPEGYASMITTNRAASAKMYYDAGNLSDTPFALVNALQQNTTWPKEEESRWEKSVLAKNKESGKAKIDDLLYLAKAYDQENKLGLFGESADTPEGITIPTALNDSIQHGGHGLTLITALNILSAKQQLSNFETRMFSNIIQVMTREGLYGERKKITLEFLIQSML